MHSYLMVILAFLVLFFSSVDKTFWLQMTIVSWALTYSLFCNILGKYYFHASQTFFF